MSGFAGSWYRVANLKPRLRTHAEIHRHQYRNQLWYVLQDRQNGRFFRISPAANLILCLMDGKRTMEHIWRLAGERLGRDRPTRADTLRLLAQIHQADLLLASLPPDMTELERRAGKLQRNPVLTVLRNPMAMRLPLLDPDRLLGLTLPLARLVFSRPSLLLWSVLMITGVALAMLHWHELTAGVADRLFSAQNVLILAIVYPSVKLIHELAHAITTKLGGGEVHEMGVMMLVLFPVPYVDASASSAFAGRWQRAGVAASGVMSELALAACAMIAWTYLGPGLARAAAFNVMLLSGVTTLLFNANPLLRFDGYYVLSDLLEIPNLDTRSKRYLLYVIKRYLLGMEQALSPVEASGERFWLGAYGVVAAIYRVVIMLGIARLVAGQYFIVGAALAALALAQMIGLPVARGLYYLACSPALRRQRRRAVLGVAGIFALLGFLLFGIPLPHATVSEGVVWVPEEAALRARADGAVVRLLVAPDTDVVATITVNAADRNGVHAPEAEIAVTVNGLPVIAAPASVEVGQNQSTSVARVSLSESGITTGETFTVKLSDVSGLLSASGAGVSGSGTANLTITGTLAQVNADLTTLSDTDATVAADKITLTAADNFGNIAVASTIGVNVLGFNVPASVVAGVGKPVLIGVSLADANAANGETFIASASDTTGLLSVTPGSVTGATVTGNGSTQVIISGSFAQVNAELASLSDTASTPGSDTVTFNVHDSLNNSASAANIAVAVDGLPSVTAPLSITVNQGQAFQIKNVSLAESPNSTGEAFSLVLSDSAGLLSATAMAGGSVSGAGTKQLTLSGSLVQVNAELTTLTDTDSAASDTIALKATDSFGNTGSSSIAVSVTSTLSSKISGALAGQQTTDEQSIKPFAGVAITDANSGSPTETVTVTPSTTANGALSDPNAASDGGTVLANGSYKITGTALSVSTAIDGLVFTPLAHEVAPASSVTTGFTISDTNSANVTTTDTTTTVIATAVNDAPTITGAKGGQTTNDTTPVKPFATAAVSDVDTGAEDALIILVTNSSGVATDADGALSGGGITETSTPGLYSINAESPSSLTSALQSVVFTPSREEVTGTSTLTTNFELIAVQQGAGGAVVTTTNTTTSLTVTQPLVFLGPAGGFGTIEGTSQPALIQAFGYVNTIYANGGNDSITTGSGNATVYTDGGSDSIILGGFFNTVSGGDGSHGIYAVSGDSGNDTVLGGSGNNTVVLGNGNDTVEIGGSGNLVSVGNGNDIIDLSGSNNVVKAGSPTGTDTIILSTSGGGGEQVTGGDGNFSVSVGGTGDTVTLGNGANLVFATQGMAFITTGAGNDTITLGGSGSTVNAGGGTNVITGGSGGDTFVLPVVGVGFDFIANFTTSNGDVLDLIPALAATHWNGQASSLANYVQVADSGGSAVISISPTGNGAGSGIAVLEGAGNLTLNSLLSHLQT